MGSVRVPEISLRTDSVKRFSNRFLHISTRLDWKSTELRRKFHLKFRLKSVGKKMVGIRRNRQESTKRCRIQSSFERILPSEWSIWADACLLDLSLFVSHSYISFVTFTTKQMKDDKNIALYTLYTFMHNVFKVDEFSVFFRDLIGILTSYHDGSYMSVGREVFG